jgi:hypothetical protein
MDKGGCRDLTHAPLRGGLTNDDSLFMMDYGQVVDMRLEICGLSMK